MKNNFVVTALASVLCAPTLFAVCPSVQWTPESHFATVGPGVAVHSVTAVDFDEDLVADLVSHESTVGASDGSLVARRSNGDGTFAAPVTLIEHVGERPALADMNGDGHLDLVVAAGSAVKILPGDGTSFGPPQTFSFDYTVSHLAAGNFDADATIELVTASAPGNIFVVYDNVLGNLVEIRRVTTDDVPTFVDSADFDGDGRFDVVAGGRETHRVTVYYQAADGTYPARYPMPPFDWPNRHVMGDFNRDGRPDFAVTDREVGEVQGFDNKASFSWANLLRSSIRTPMHSSKGGWKLDFGKPGDIVAADVNGDGFLDVITGADNENYVTTFTGMASGAYSLQGHFTWFRNPTWSYSYPNTFAGAIAAGDFDYDGDIDLVLASEAGYVLMTSTCSTQVFAYSRSRTITQGTSVVVYVDIGAFPPGETSSPGTVTLREGATTLASAPLFTTGHATFSISALTVGEHELTVHFSGNAHLAAGVSPPVPIKVVVELTQTTMTITPAEKVYGNPISVEVEVTGDNIAPGEPMTVILTVPGKTDYHNTGDGPVIVYPPAGGFLARARFPGDDTRPASETTTQFEVEKMRPAITHTGGALTVRAGTPHTLTFEVTGAAIDPNPVSGKLQLRTSALGIIADGTLVDGAVTLTTTTALPLGTHAVIAAYHQATSNYKTNSINVTLNVVSDSASPIAISATGLAHAVRVAYALPENTDPGSLRLYRWQKGTTTWTWRSGWDPATGLDTPARGIVYEYKLDAELENGDPITSNVDGALLFTDDPLTVGTPIMWTHWNELGAALNERRAEAGLGLYVMPPTTYPTHALINGLRAFVNDLRTRTGYPAHTWSQVIGAGTIIRASHVQEIRELIR